MEAGRVYIGWSSHRFYDYFEPIKCFKCNRYGHSSKDCRAEGDTLDCLKCGKTGHESTKCIEAEQTCQPICPSCKDHAKRMKCNDSTFKHWPESRTCPTRAFLINKAKSFFNTNNEQ